MAEIAILRPSPVASDPRSTTAPPLWIVGAVVLGVTSIITGLIWDISWHRTIGRDIAQADNQIGLRSVAGEGHGEIGAADDVDVFGQGRAVEHQGPGVVDPLVARPFAGAAETAVFAAG